MATRILRSSRGGNLPIDEFPKDLLKIIDDTLKGKDQIILNYSLKDINKKLKKKGVRVGRHGLRERISQLNLDNRILRGSIPGVKYAKREMVPSVYIIKDFVEEANRKIREGIANENLNTKDLKRVGLNFGEDLAKKLKTTRKQAYSAFENYERNINQYKRKGLTPLMDLDKAQADLTKKLVTKANEGLPYVRKLDILKKSGLSLNSKGALRHLKKLDSYEDKVVKAGAELFKDSATKAEDLFNPFQKIAKMVSPSGSGEWGRPRSDRIRTEILSPHLKKAYPEMIPVLNKLGNTSFKKKVLDAAKKGEVWTLGDVEKAVQSGSNLRAPKNVYERMVSHAIRHQKGAPAGKALTQIYDSMGKPVRDLTKLNSYANITFKYRPNTNIDFNTIKNTYGVNAGLVEPPRNSKFMDLTRYGREMPEFKEYFHNVDEIERLRGMDVKHPVSGKTVKFSQLMGEAYEKGAGYKTSYERFPYDIDHRFGVEKDPFKNLRVIPQRLNVAAGRAAQHNPEYLEKMGYLFDKTPDELAKDEVRLADDILNKGRKLRTSYQISQDLAERGRTAASAYVPESITTEVTPGEGFNKFLTKLYQQPEFKMEMENAMNETAGRKICRDGCFIKVGKQNPGLLQKTLQKLSGKGGRLGAIIAGAGALGLGAGALFGGSEAKAEEVFQEPGTTELEAQDITIEEPASMAYNATEGNFVNAEGERETQPGMLNWIADNPTKSSLAALPLMMGAGFGLDKAGSKFGNESVARSGLKSAGKYLTGWKALIPAMMIPHALYEYKAGHDIPEMVTNPINALWALGIRGEKDLKLVKDYYDDMKKVGRRGLDMTTLKGLKSVKGWKSLPRDFQTAMMSPAAKGTNMAFGTTFRKPFVKTMGALDGIAATQGAKAWGKKALLRAALIPAGILAATPAGWLTAGFLGADFLWDQYKDYRDGNVRIDEMRARGSISEDEAKNYRSLLLQGSIPFGMGNRMFGPDTMRIGGEDLDPTQQRELLKGMEAQLDEWQGGDMERRAKFREDHFADGGRVGMKFGGEMDRRTFLKWLGALAAGATGIFKGKSKDVVKPLVVDATKTIPAKFVGVEGMPAWFPRLIAKIKTHGKLIEMADKKYIQGDIYEMVIPVKVPKFDRVAGKEQMSGFETVNKKIVMEDNPLSGEIEITWSVEDFDGEMTRQINFKPGTAGYQKFGVDPEHPTAWEYQRVKVEEPEFSYGNPDQANPYREEFEYKDIFTQADEVVDGMEALTKTKQMVAKDGSVIDVSAEGKGVDKEFQKKMYKDIEGEGALQADPEGQMTPEGWQGEGTPEFIEGDIPDWVPKDEWPKKAAGGIIETGNIARRPGAVPPLSGPTPQGEGIVGLFSNPKQVNVGS